MDWETGYIKVRKKEGFYFSDEEVRRLPVRPNTDPNYRRWLIRQRSADKLIHYIERTRHQRILDLGCGNGWFTHQLYQACGDRIISGWDVNHTEIQQAKRVFSAMSEQFAVQNIFDDSIFETFDLILLNSVFQYFEDSKATIGRLLELLRPNGEIHIVDTPFYSKNTVAAARQRTLLYYRRLGHEEMAQYYHHHIMSDLECFSVSYLYRPTTIWNRVRRKINKVDSPFPWLRIMKSNEKEAQSV